MVRFTDKELAIFIRICVRAAKIPDLDIISQLCQHHHRPSTIDSLTHELKVPRSTLMRRLNKMEKDGRVVVNKTSRHHEYQLAVEAIENVKGQVSSLAEKMLSTLGSFVIALTLFSF